MRHLFYIALALTIMALAPSMGETTTPGGLVTPVSLALGLLAGAAEQRGERITQA